jgi:hypothetical protein
MALTTPKHRATLWVLANITWVAVAPAAALYYEPQQRGGAYPVDADSIGLPIVGIAIWVIVLLLPLNFACWFLLRRYPGRVSLDASGKGLGTGKQLVGVIGVIFAISCGAAAIWALTEDAGEVTPVFLAWSYIVLAIRATYLAATREPNTSLL